MQAALWRQYQDRRCGGGLPGQTGNDYRRPGLYRDRPAPHQCKVSRVVLQGIRMKAAAVFTQVAAPRDTKRTPSYRNVPTRLKGHRSLLRGTRDRPSLHAHSLPLFSSS